MRNVSVNSAIKKYNDSTVINKEQLNGYGGFLNNIKEIKDIKNTHLEIVAANNSKKETSVNIAKLSKDLISKIRDLYTPDEISSYRIGDKNKEKSIGLLNEAYGKIDADILDWWRNEKKILPSSIINRTIDKLYYNDKIIINKETKQSLFFLISRQFKLDLDCNAVQSTMIQHLQDIPAVVKAIDDLNISNNSYLKYEIYCLLAEDIYNCLSGNENEVDFYEIKKAIKEVVQRKIGTSKNELTYSSFYPTLTLAFCRN